MRQKKLARASVVSLALFVGICLLWLTDGAVMVRRASASFTTIGWGGSELKWNTFHFPPPGFAVGTVYGESGRGRSGQAIAVNRPGGAGQWGRLKNVVANDRQTDMVRPIGTADSVWVPVWPGAVATILMPGVYVFRRWRTRLKDAGRRGFDVEPGRAEA